MRTLYVIVGLLLAQISFASEDRIKPVTLSFHNTLFDKTCCLVISHAGGGIEGHAYSSSQEALDANYALGRRVFELDLIQTSDGAWVATHDWKTWADKTNREGTRTFYEAIQDAFSDEYVPTKAEFLAAKMHGKFTPIALENIVAWLQRHPDAVLLPDTKNSFPDFVKAISSYHAVSKQIILQAYFKSDLDFLKSRSIALSNVIFSNYKAELTPDELIALVQQENIGALTITRLQALEFGAVLRQKLPNTPIYVHGAPASINSLELQYRLKQAGASGFYLD